MSDALFHTHLSISPLKQAKPSHGNLPSPIAKTLIFSAKDAAPATPSFTALSAQVLLASGEERLHLAQLAVNALQPDQPSHAQDLCDVVHGLLADPPMLCVPVSRAVAETAMLHLSKPDAPVQLLTRTSPVRRPRAGQPPLMQGWVWSSRCMVQLKAAAAEWLALGAAVQAALGCLQQHASPVQQAISRQMVTLLCRIAQLPSQDKLTSRGVERGSAQLTPMAALTPVACPEATVRLLSKAALWWAADPRHALQQLLAAAPPPMSSWAGVVLAGAAEAVIRGKTQALAQLAPGMLATLCDMCAAEFQASRPRLGSCHERAVPHAALMPAVVCAVQAGQALSALPHARDLLHSLQRGIGAGSSAQAAAWGWSHAALLSIRDTHAGLAQLCEQSLQGQLAVSGVQARSVCEFQAHTSSSTLRTAWAALSWAGDDPGPAGPPAMFCAAGTQTSLPRCGLSGHAPGVDVGPGATLHAAVPASPDKRTGAASQPTRQQQVRARDPPPRHSLGITIWRGLQRILAREVFPTADRAAHAGAKLLADATTLAAWVQELLHPAQGVHSVHRVTVHVSAGMLHAALSSAASRASGAGLAAAASLPPTRHTPMSVSWLMNSACWLAHDARALPAAVITALQGMAQQLSLPCSLVPGVALLCAAGGSLSAPCVSWMAALPANVMAACPGESLWVALAAKLSAGGPALALFQPHARSEAREDVWARSAVTLSCIARAAMLAVRAADACDLLTPAACALQSAWRELRHTIRPALQDIALPQQSPAQLHCSLYMGERSFQPAWHEALARALKDRCSCTRATFRHVCAAAASTATCARGGQWGVWLTQWLQSGQHANAMAPQVAAVLLETSESLLAALPSSPAAARAGAAAAGHLLRTGSTPAVRGAAAAMLLHAAFQPAGRMILVEALSPSAVRAGQLPAAEATLATLAAWQRRHRQAGLHLLPDVVLLSAELGEMPSDALGPLLERVFDAVPWKAWRQALLALPIDVRRHVLLILRHAMELGAGARQQHVTHPRQLQMCQLLSQQADELTSRESCGAC